MYTRESFHKVFDKIFLDYNFQFPLSWVWISVNGAFLTGRFERSNSDKKFESILLTGKVKKIIFPINAMIVDANGAAAHVLLKKNGEIGEVTRCRSDQPMPATPLGWPIGCGKA